MALVHPFVRRALGNLKLGPGLGRRAAVAFSTSTILAPVAVDALGATPKTAEGAKELYEVWAADYDEALVSWDYPAPRRVAEEVAAHFAAHDSTSVPVGVMLDAGFRAPMTLSLHPPLLPLTRSLHSPPHSTRPTHSSIHAPSPVVISPEGDDPKLFVVCHRCAPLVLVSWRHAHRFAARDVTPPGGSM